MVLFLCSSRTGKSKCDEKIQNSFLEEYEGGVYLGRDVRTF